MKVEKRNNDFDFYSDEKLSELLINGNNESICLFISRVLWKLMMDIDEDGTGYDVDDWEVGKYIDFIKRLDEVDLNKDSYRNYFKWMFLSMINNVNNK
jgi:hypothetical protein